MNKWERITEYTERLKVPGGWLVKVTETWDGYQHGGMGVAMTFVADSEYRWEAE